VPPGKGFVSLVQLRDHLLGPATLPVRRALHRRLLSAPWAVKVSTKGGPVHRTPVNPSGGPI
jgi:hypothetical protein